jgi:hypothetical protein
MDHIDDNVDDARDARYEDSDDADGDKDEASFGSLV